MNRRSLIVLIILIITCLLTTITCQHNQPDRERGINRGNKEFYEELQVSVSRLKRYLPSLITDIISCISLLLFSLTGTLCTASPTEVPDTVKTSPRFLTSSHLWMRRYAQRAGKTPALEAFVDPKGSFTIGDVSIRAYDFAGIYLIHPFHPEYRGPIYSLLDPDGFPMIEAMRDTALNGS